jgi:hypothetical protein
MHLVFFGKSGVTLLDMFSGYRQIRVRREDEEETGFITPSGTSCVVRMPEGLKNAECTFSRMIAIVLHPQLRRNILTYVDDIVVKCVQEEIISAIWQKLSRIVE